MNFNIFNQFCLICTNYHCQQQSYHKKYTILQIQHILLSYVSSRVSNFSSSNSNQLNKHHYKLSGQKQSSSESLTLPVSFCQYLKHGTQKLFQKLAQKHSHLYQTAPLDKCQFQLLLYSSLGNVLSFSQFQRHPLIYHDITQLIKLIGIIKMQLKDINQTDITFTQSRITKTIKFMQKQIRTKNIKQLSLQNKQKEQRNILNDYKENFNSSNIFRDIGNRELGFKAQGVNRIGNQCSFLNKKETTSYSKIHKLSDCQQHIFQQITKILTNIQNNHINPSKKQQKLIYQSFISLVSEIENTLVQKLKQKSQEQKYLKRQQNLFDNRQNQQNYNLLNNLYLNPEKNKDQENEVEYNLKNLSEQQDKSRLMFNQEAQYIQFAYLQGIPFPTNRRTIDFSMLQITDALLLSYLSALQKFKDLQQICLRNNKLSYLGYQLLKNIFPKLRSLDIRQNVITEQMAQIIIQFQNLNILYISQSQISPTSLVKMCLNLNHLNFFYCDRLKFSSQIDHSNNNVNFKQLFYIICMNLKKLLFISLKGYFSQKVISIHIKKLSENGKQQKISVTQEQLVDLTMLVNIQELLRKRHGYAQV